MGKQSRERENEKQSKRLGQQGAEKSALLTRRRFLVMAGATGVALAYGLTRGPKPLDLSFLDAMRGNVENFVALLEPAPTTLDASPQGLRDALKSVGKQEEIKNKWYALGGSPEVTIDAERVTEQKGYIPELESRIANAYRVYSDLCMRYALRECGLSFAFESRVPPVQPRKEMVLIVNSIAQRYAVSYVIRDAAGHHLEGGLELTLMDDAQGRSDFHIHCEEDGSVRFMEYPILLATASGKSAVLEGPVAEVLHKAIQSGTKRLANEELSRRRAENPQEIKRRARDSATVYDEALVHAAVPVVMQKLKKDYVIPYGPEDVESRLRDFAHYDNYSLLPQGVKFIEHEGLSVLKEYRDNPHSVLRRLKAQD